MSAPHAPTTHAPAWRDPWVCAAVVCLIAWHLAVAHVQWGARAADSVEYIDRATLLARDLRPGAETPRSPFYSVALLPVRRALDAAGVRDVQTFVVLARAFASAFSAVALLLAAELARRLTNDVRAARLLAWLLATDLTFAAWGCEPLSVPLATTCLLAGVLAATSARASRRVASGPLFGVAIAAKYQVFALVPFLVWMGRRPTRRAPWTRLASALLAALICSALADLYAYGAWNVTWWRYLRANVLPLGYSALHPLLPTTWSVALQEWLFDLPVSEHLRSGLPLARRYPWHHYVTAWGEWLSPAGLVLALFAVVSGLRFRVAARPWRPLAALLLANFLLLSLKGAKEARLLFPWIPWFWLLVALLAAPVLARRRGVALVAAMLVGAAAWPALSLADRRPAGTAPNDLERLQRHWSYAEAMRWLARIGPRPGRPPFEVVASYHFAVAFEETPGVFVVKTPHALDAYEVLAPEERREVDRVFAPRSVVHLVPPTGAKAAEIEHEARAAARTFGGGDARTIRGYDGTPVLELDVHHEHLPAFAAKVAALGGVIAYQGVSRPEWTLTHSQTLTHQPALLARIAADYELAAIFYEPRRSTRDYHPLWALRRRGMDPNAVPLLVRGDLPEGVGEGFRPIVFEDADGPCFELLGVDVHPRFARDGYVVATWHWRARRAMDVSWTFAHRATLGGRDAIQIDAPPGYGAAPTTSWRPGEVVSETLVFPLPSGFANDSPSATVDLWVGAYAPHLPPGSHPRARSRTGFPPSPDGLVRVGGCLAGPRRDRSLP